MGKIVRGAEFEAECYVVRVPEPVASVPAAPADGELDARFAAPLDFDLALPPAIEPSLDWEAVAGDARALIDAAASDAEALLRDAAAQARALVESARAEAGAIRAQAHADGVAEGVAAGRVQIESDLAATVANLRAVVDEARAQRNKVIEEAEPEIVRLAMSVAERIVHDHIAVEPSVVVANVKSALTRLVGREVVTLRVNPDDVETIRAHRDAIAGSNDVERLRIVEDQRVDRGGVIVETDAGTIDAKIGTQIREARRTIATGTLAPAQAS